MIGDGRQARGDAGVDVRCSVAVVRDDEFLLIHRVDSDDWVLPGGTPQRGELLTACARREAWEETGLDVTARRCAFVLEVLDATGRRRVDLVFAAEARGDAAPRRREADREPCWVPLERLPGLRLRPPLAGYLPGLARGARGTAPYLGDMWRPDEAG